MIVADGRAVFVDVDGTLTDDISAWEKVHHIFELKDEMNHHQELYYSGKISYAEWARLDVSLWKGKSYRLLQKSLKDPVLRKGAKEGVGMLKNAGFDVILISGGIDEMVKDVANTVGADLFLANSIGHDNGIINGEVNIIVGNSKDGLVTKVAKDRNYNLKTCGAIGDNVNDIEMFKTVGYSVAINTDKRVVIEAANEFVPTHDFSHAAESILKNIGR